MKSLNFSALIVEACFVDAEQLAAD